ncbi:MAG: UDP-N-acetylglucosamine--N-acetylmuramyl-(pentapeptide) pyrophosphoryl-undecaprenol N-acetylglucosamine transferase [bacterium]|nr:UDP-N-acetylglucosamine--N-acetylmuramyl-(pentapeptide) pyrophosphoryl-undecaprenol N-acetylglucosamine transferase [bacterium]
MAIDDASPPRHALARLAIAGGGTGGHVFPAVAIAETCNASRPTLDVLFLGTATGFEARIAPAHGLRFAAVRAAPFYGVARLDRVRTLSHLFAGVMDARRILRAERVQLVLGLGGFASAGVVLAARSLGVPAVIHEANATAGLANRALGRVADRVLLGFADAMADFPPGRCTVTGTPVRPALLSIAAGRTPLGRPFRLLVMGGSQGSPFLNTHAPELVTAIARLGVSVTIRHQTGAGGPEAVRAAYADAGIAADVTPFLDDVRAAYEHADFAITCAGAGTLSELAAIGLPALVVPLASAARDHEVANARAAAESSGVWWTTERTWDTTTLAQRIAVLAGDAAAWRAASTRMRRGATPAAATHILAACDELLAARAG